MYVKLRGAFASAMMSRNNLTITDGKKSVNWFLNGNSKTAAGILSEEILPTAVFEMAFRARRYEIFALPTPMISPEALSNSIMFAPLKAMRIFSPIS